MSEGKDEGSILTRSKPFKLVVKKAFAVCDNDKTGEVGKPELYAGLLLVHLRLSKYAGPAACYPPSREVCDALFDAADKDNSGGIDEQEFVKIMGVCCAQILTRMLTFYLVLILLVPYLSARIVDWMKIPNGSYKEMATEQIVSTAFFMLAIPFLWDNIDTHSAKVLETDNLTGAHNHTSTITSSEAETVPEESDKKDD